MKLCDFCINNRSGNIVCSVIGQRAKLANMRVKYCDQFTQYHPESCDVVFLNNDCEIGFSSVEHLKKTERNKNLKIQRL